MDIQFKKVTYAYADDNGNPQVGLNEIELNMMHGKFTAILGPSGSGKSTLLQHLNGLFKPQKGAVQILNTTINNHTDAETLHQLRRQVGLVFQFPEQQLFEESVEKEISFGLRNFGISEANASQAAREAAELVGLDQALLSCNPLQLSGGQMRKVAIASVLAMSPDIIALDEPTASLDQMSRYELLSLLDQLCREHGKTVIVVTHRLEEVFPYADHFVMMDEGSVLFRGNAHYLIQQAAKLEQAGFQMPTIVRLWKQVSDRFQVDIPTEVRSVKDLATYIKSLDLVSHI